jgi:predicted aconitase
MRFENFEQIYEVLERERNAETDALVVFLRDVYKSAKELGKIEGIKECIQLSDTIEMREPDGGTKEWMAFKAFRNEMRDRLKQ